MPITVRFSRNGCYIPALGRLGMGDNAGKIYTLPDAFRAPGMLPLSAEILDEVSEEDMEELLEEANQSRPDRPKVDTEELERAVAAAKGQSSVERKKIKGAKTVAEAQRAAGAEEPSAAEASSPKRRARRAAG
jgi:hypothetical protein